MSPFYLVGLALAGGLALLKSSSSSSETAATTDSALIDPSEKSHPNAETARKAIVNAMHFNSLTLFEKTAVAIETTLKMPKTAANVRTWATMAQQGGQTVAGDEVGGAEGYGDEVGAARRRVVRNLYARHTAKPKAKPKRRASSARAAPMLSSSSSSESAPLVEWDEGDDESDDEGDDEEVGAAAGSAPKKKKLPDWLRFSATQSKLAGDPKFIRATAQVMRAMGYAKHADIHLKAIV